MWYLIFQVIISILFLGWIVMSYGVLPSISDSFKVLEKKYGRGSLIPWIFWLYLINVAWPLWVLMQPLGTAFFAMCGIILVGAAARFWSGKSTEIPHIIGAVGGFILAFISFGIDYGFWGWVFAATGIIMTFVLKKVNIKKVNGKITFNEVPNCTWWVEVQAMLLIFIFEGIFIV